MLELAREVDVMRKDGSRLLSQLRMARRSISHVTAVQVGRVILGSSIRCFWALAGRLGLFLHHPMLTL